MSPPSPPCRLRPETLHRARRVAAELRGAWRLSPPGVSIAANGWPPPGRALHLDDLSGIPRVQAVHGIERYQLRARWRAQRGEAVLSTRPVPEGFESYACRHLGLHEARWMLADGGFELSRACWNDRRCFRSLVDWAANGPIYLHPYMAFADTWELAERLSRAVAGPVPVLGPPPDLCSSVNDKARFMTLVRELLGDAATIPYRSSANPAELVRHTSELLGRYPKVALRTSSGASGVGLRILEAARLPKRSSQSLGNVVREFLNDVRWDGSEEILVVRWQERTLLSPSLQLWIPPSSAGSILCEGVFSQRFTAGCEGEFAGAVPARLPAGLERRLVYEATAIAEALRNLGYHGRCSLDAIVVGERLGDAEVRFVDCNGRWGGVSAPLTLLNRLFGDYRQVGFVLRDVIDHRLRGLTFRELARILHRDLYGVNYPKGRLILYNVGCLREHGKLGILALGANRFEAERVLDELLPMRLGLQAWPTP